MRRLSCPGCGAVWRHQDVLLVGPSAPDELLDDLGGVELPGDGDEAAVVLAEALALQTQPLGDPAEEEFNMKKYVQEWSKGWFPSCLNYTLQRVTANEMGMKIILFMYREDWPR